jgi:hypothetical protein
MSRPPITAESIHFHLRPDGYTTFDRSPDSRIDAFGWWVTEDLQSDLSHIAWVADGVARHMSQPDAELEEFGGNAWVAIVTDKMMLENKFNDTLEELALDEAATLLHVYWDHCVEKKRAERTHEELQHFRQTYGREPVLPWSDGDPQGG